MSKQYRDEIAGVCHDMMKDIQAVGGVTEADIREFEKNCFVSVPEMSSEFDNPRRHGKESPAFVGPRK